MNRPVRDPYAVVVWEERSREAPTPIPDSTVRMMKKHIPLAVASLLCAFFVLDIILIALGTIISRTLYECGNPFVFIGNVGFATCLFVYYKLPTWPFMAFLAAAGSSVIALWFQRNRGNVKNVLAAVYTLAVALHIAYVAWWYLTGQKWDYI